MIHIQKTFAACCLAFLLLTLSAVQAADRPNIVLIMADDVGCDALGCYGGQSYETPRLDALASTGMRFRFCFSMPVCHPTRICLLTGRYPFRHGHPAWGTFPRQAEQQTLAHVMQQAGYATAIAGKWQLTMMRDEPDHPHRLGFDEYCLFGWHEGPRYYAPMIYQNGKLREGLAERYGPDVYTEFLMDFIERHRERPFLAFYSMALCHDVTDDLDEPVPLGPEGRYDTYDEMIQGMDQRVGRLVDALDRLQLREKTVLLFTTDNGTPKQYIHTARDGRLIRKPVVSLFRGERVAGGKGELTNAGTNVPLIASWPGTISSGQVVDDLVDLSDFLPTLAELGQAQRPDRVAIDGQSFASRLRGTAGPTRQWVFAEQGRRHWVRNQRWKLYGNGRLFDVEHDPHEKRPVPATVAGAARARSQLSTILAELSVR